MNTSAGRVARKIYLHPVRSSCKTTLIFATLGMLALCHSAANAFVADLADLSLEQLAALPVTSVSKSAMPLSVAPASIFVITQRDVRRSRATTLPEALRLAPNLQVARMDTRTYAVSTRGFNNIFANKLLVMIDGRAVYSPLYSGVFWDAQDVMLEDLERVEVVSGPGGTLWGANAVNGVINIVTRSAADTQGELFSLGAGSHETHGAMRYGGSLPDDGHYRVYAKHSEHDDTRRANGELSQTGWERTQTGFRADWGKGEETLTIQGDAYTGRLGQFGNDDIEISGANLLATRSWELFEDSKFSVQTYYDHTQRNQPGGFAQHLNTFDIEIQHEYKMGDRHTLMWGAGYRYLDDSIENDGELIFLPENLTTNSRNIFVQDEIAPTQNTRLTLGTKWEDNHFTGWESLPSIQLAWTPGKDKLIWTSASRAVRAPSRIDRDLFSPSNPMMLDGVPFYVIAGGPEFESEIAEVFEVGYRSQPAPHVSWSITGFYSEYDKLRTLGPTENKPGLTFQNHANAISYGIEMWGSWQATPKWRLHGGFVSQEIDTRLDPGTYDVSARTALAARDPRYYGLLRSSFDLSDRIMLDASLRHIDELKDIDVPAYTTLDVRLAWAATPRLEISLIGQNLLEDQHSQFGAAATRSEFERAFFGKLVWGL
jgi:iron complex outermembrane receptor protein